jgi:UDP-N-acetylglucosamine 2-epimerase (non-hydrolysing)
MHLLHVVGARPNFMKAAPLIRVLGHSAGVRQTLVHTGQHYDASMSDVFFQQLELPAPDFNLEVGSGTNTQQTAAIMSRLESTLASVRPDMVIVYGDVNSTVAAALVAARMRIPLAHVEAGLRSFDRSMPEEINRIVTDQLADLLFTTSLDGNDHLKAEGIPLDKVHFVGNVMIDTLVRMLPKVVSSDRLPLRYVLVTLHRPSNVDDPAWLLQMFETLNEISHDVPVIFPIHPRTRQNMQALGSRYSNNGLQLIEPVSYLESLALQRNALAVITDSGGIQEETTFLGVPCLTVRENTERPVTVNVGTNILVGRDTQRVKAEIQRILTSHKKPASIPALWDGKAAERIAQIITRDITS